MSAGVLDTPLRVIVLMLQTKFHLYYKGNFGELTSIPPDPLTI